jgi:short subunit dehydrogenase-like uncharacterized protein
MSSGSCDFGKGERPTVQVSWGDVSTAYHSTGIPNIEVQFEALPAIRRMTQTPAIIKSFLGLGFMQSFLKAQVDWMPEGPSEATRRAGHAVIVGEARNSDGQTVRSRLRTPEGYTLTALTAFDGRGAWRRARSRGAFKRRAAHSVPTTSSPSTA